MAACVNLRYHLLKPPHTAHPQRDTCFIVPIKHTCYLFKSSIKRAFCGSFSYCCRVRHSATLCTHLIQTWIKHYIICCCCLFLHHTFSWYVSENLTWIVSISNNAGKVWLFCRNNETTVSQILALKQTLAGDRICLRLLVQQLLPFQSRPKQVWGGLRPVRTGLLPGWVTPLCHAVLWRGLCFISEKKRN